MKKLYAQLITMTVCLLMVATTAYGVNTSKTVEQVTGQVTLTDDVDYIVSSATPFADNGIVNIENTEHAVLILLDVKPSKAKSLLASHVEIGGEKAVVSQNCQLKMYNRGCIIMPYGRDLKPLTVYSETNFQGEECSDFGLESTNGFMNTLSDNQLNNRIRSFRLKRGHMVTFSLKAEGRGYSRCFIAADRDLEVSALPAIMDRSISSYRVFRWYDAGKPQLAAAGGDAAACNALNVTSTYSWSAGTDMLPNQECVSHQIYSTWPSPSDCGKPTYTCHLKTSNEPRNSSDDHPEDLNAILAAWPDLMRTGMRLCTPSSWDGSDYWNGTGFLKTFLDSIDARGWRCDVLDMHCYWPEGNFGNLRNWVNAVHRPIWISEWCWGASWNQNGAFADGVTKTQVRDALQRICNALNGYDYVERYFYWNGERDISKVYLNGALTPAGEMYSKLDGGLAYNGKYDYVPKAPEQRDPKDLTVSYDSKNNKASIRWFEYNGEQNEYIHIECRKSQSDEWTVVADITGIENSGYFTVDDIEARLGWEFRIVEKDANGRSRATSTVMTAISDISAGEAVDVDGKTMYIGGNILTNGRFDMGLTTWTNGKGATLDKPWFQTIEAGGSDGGSYLQAYGNGGADSESALKTVIDIQPGTYYYFAADASNLTSQNCTFALSSNGQQNDLTIGKLNNTTSKWQTQFFTANSGTYNKALVTFHTLGSQSQLDNIVICRLFDTPEEALADGAEAQRKRAQAFKNYTGNAFATVIDNVLATTDTEPAMDMARVKQAVDEAIRSYNTIPHFAEVFDDAKQLIALSLPDDDRLKELCDETEKQMLTGAWPSTTWVEQQCQALEQAIAEFMPMTEVTGKIQSPDFSNATATGWETRAGTYRDGTQQQKSDKGRTYWSAVWKIAKENHESETMAIRQNVSSLMHGLYSLKCIAATDHYCLSDQHAYISNGTDSIVSHLLTTDRLDLPNIADSLRWQTLSTVPMYIKEGGSIAIGFTGSKQYADDLAWRQIGNTSSQGDHREGSWAATAFRLLYHPLYRIPTSQGQFGCACLPYTVTPSPAVSFYKIVAITADYDSLCLEPINETEAGVPFMYMANQPDATLLEYGEAVTKTTDGPGNLRGFLATSSVTRVPTGYYWLTNGVWQKVTASGSERPHLDSNTGIMRPFTDRMSKPLPVVDNWDGPTVAIQGITDEEKALMPAGIDTITYSDDSKTANATYDLQGRKVSNTKQKKGIFIRNNKKFIAH
jgi:hypothetical protein